MTTETTDEVQQFKDDQIEVVKICFEGFMPKSVFDANKEELPYQFKLYEAQNQLRALADLTDNPNEVYATFEKMVHHNGKLEIKVEKKLLRAQYFDADNEDAIDVITSEPVTVLKVVLETFIVDKKSKASIYYKGPNNIIQHNKLANRAEHKMKLTFCQPQAELFAKD